MNSQDIDKDIPSDGMPNVAGKKKKVVKIPKIKRENPWSSHVKKFCIENNMKYRDALRSDECKKQYYGVV